MIEPRTYTGKGVAVLGLGKTGRAALEAFAAAGASPLIAWDDAAAAQHDLPPGTRLAAPDGIDWGAMSLLVPSPGVPADHPMTNAARAAGCSVLSDIEVLWETAPRARYIGVTGTNGKSTTTALIAHILAAAGRTVAAGGNLGTPALAMPPLAADGTYALELSSYQLALSDRMSFDVAVLLNISPDHLEWHGTMAAYVGAKKHIFRPGRLKAAIVGVDDDESRRIYDELDDAGVPGLVPVTTRRQCQLGVSVEGGILRDRGQEVCNLIHCPALTGEHNWQNAGAAWAAARALDVPEDAIVRALRDFPGLAHRMETVATFDGIAFVNDSKATNADAAARALSSYEHIYWIAGGLPKSGGLAAARPGLGRVRHAFLIGEAADAFAQELKGRTPFTVSGDLDTAVAEAAAMARADGLPGAVVLLSPACASFDQFASFEARGDAFRSLVMALENGLGTNSRRASAK